MYTVAYNDGWKTENWFFDYKRNSENKMKKICDELNIYPIPFNTKQELAEGWLERSEIITEEQKQKGIFSSKEAKAKRAEYMREYRKNNKEKVRQQKNKQREKNKEYQKKWREKNRDKINTNHKKWREKNRDKVQTYYQRTYRKEKEKSIKELNNNFDNNLRYVGE